MTNIFSTDQIHTLHHTFFHPTGTVKATLLICHGMAEHSERYANFAQFLADHGIAVLTYDHLGHGRSVNKASELGYFAKEHPMQTVLKDVIVMADTLKSRYQNVPHFIMGHSMGSFIVRVVLKHHSSEFAGAILMGTSDTDPIVEIALPLTRLLNKTLPERRNRRLATLTNHLLNAKIKDKTSAEHAWVCKNEQALQAYNTDPLCGFNFTNNGYLTLFSLMKVGLAKNWANTVQKNLPLLLVSGEDDPIGNMGKGIRKLSARLQKQGFNNVSVQLYDNMRHEPLHEMERELVYADILSWLESSIQNTALNA